MSGPCAGKWRWLTKKSGYLEFVLVPPNEDLAEVHLINSYGGKLDTWSEFFSEAVSKEGAPGVIKGILLAVRDCATAKGKTVIVPLVPKLFRHRRKLTKE